MNVPRFGPHERPWRESPGFDDALAAARARYDLPAEAWDAMGDESVALAPMPGNVAYLAAAATLFGPSRLTATPEQRSTARQLEATIHARHAQPLPQAASAREYPAAVLEARERYALPPAAWAHAAHVECEGIHAAPLTANALARLAALAVAFGLVAATPAERRTARSILRATAAPGDPTIGAPSKRARKGHRR